MPAAEAHKANHTHRHGVSLKKKKKNRGSGSASDTVQTITTLEEVKADVQKEFYMWNQF